MGKERADMIYFDHGKASGTISHDSFMQELGIKIILLQGCTTRCKNKAQENGFNGLLLNCGDGSRKAAQKPIQSWTLLSATPNVLSQGQRGCSPHL